MKDEGPRRVQILIVDTIDQNEMLEDVVRDGLAPREGLPRQESVVHLHLEEGGVVIRAVALRHILIEEFQCVTFGEGLGCHDGMDKCTRQQQKDNSLHVGVDLDMRVRRYNFLIFGRNKKTIAPEIRYDKR